MITRNSIELSVNCTSLRTKKNLRTTATTIDIKEIYPKITLT